MSILQAKSQINECENIRRSYQNIDRQISRRKDDLENVNNDWQEATSRKLSSTSDVQRALLAGAQNALIRQKQRLKAEIRALNNDRDDLRNDYNFRRCAAMTGGIG